MRFSPTADWTALPADEAEVTSPPRKVSKFDVGNCLIPENVMEPDLHWLDAQPLLGLQGEQFLKLSSPCVNTPEQLWSVRHQFLKSADRIGVLERQDAFWADDEIRFHLHAICQQRKDDLIRQGVHKN